MGIHGMPSVDGVFTPSQHARPSRRDRPPFLEEFP